MGEEIKKLSRSQKSNGGLMRYNTSSSLSPSILLSSSSYDTYHGKTIGTTITTASPAIPTTSDEDPPTSASNFPREVRCSPSLFSPQGGRRAGKRGYNRHAPDSPEQGDFSGRGQRGSHKPRLSGGHGDHHVPGPPRDRRSARCQVPRHAPLIPPLYPPAGLNSCSCFGTHTHTRLRRLCRRPREMKIATLLASAGINVALCAVLLSVFSLLRRKPGNAGVYFGRRLAERSKRKQRAFRFERLVPSPSWIIKVWEYTKRDILTIAGLDAIVFLRMLVFSIRVFLVAAVVCLFGVLPLNYLGKDTPRKYIPSENLDAFTIANVEEGSKWLWVHCLTLYIICFSACILLYLEYKNISQMRLAQFTKSPTSLHHFTILVRAIPKSKDKSFSDVVKDFFTTYHSSTYLSHQMIYRSGKIQKLMNEAEEVYKKLLHAKDAIDKKCHPTEIRCGLCIGTSDSFQLCHVNSELDERNPKVDADYSAARLKDIHEPADNRLPSKCYFDFILIYSSSNNEVFFFCGRPHFIQC